MKDRLKQIVQYKTNGVQNEFGRLCGWSSQYTNRVLHDGCIGINPVIAVIKAFPDIDARWLLTGEGTMIDASFQYNTICQKALDVVKYSKYISVMSQQEIDAFINGTEPINEAQIDVWQTLLDVKNANIEKAFTDAYQTLQSRYNIYK